MKTTAVLSPDETLKRINSDLAHARRRLDFLKKRTSRFQEELMDRLGHFSVPVAPNEYDLKYLEAKCTLTDEAYALLQQTLDVLDGFSPLRRAFFLYRFGLGGVAGHTPEETAARFGITPEREAEAEQSMLRRIHYRTRRGRIKKLKDYLG